MNQSEKLHLRHARPGDLTQVMEIERVSFSDPWPQTALLGELHCDGLRYSLVAERAGRVEGYLMAWRIMNQLHVLNLAVAPQARRLGTGSRLLATALETAESWGLREVTLEVRESNAAARLFYTRHGFRDIGRRPRYYRDTDEDAIIMSWSRAGPEI